MRLQDCCGTVSFEERVLAKLGLSPAPISTQILPPEPLSYFLFSCIMLSAALAQFGRDCRHLMRTEIAEVAESFEDDQAGSSTMPFKRNPIHFEQLEGMWIRTKNEFGKVLDTTISEHQRDLVGSSVERDFPTILVNLQVQLNALLRKNKKGVPFLSRITVDKAALEKNLQRSANVVSGELLYIALQMAGYEGDAHELVNRELTPQAQSTGKSVLDVLEEKAAQDESLARVLASIPRETYDILVHPERNIGLARDKALMIADLAVLTARSL